MHLLGKECQAPQVHSMAHQGDVHTNASYIGSSVYSIVVATCLYSHVPKQTPREGCWEHVILAGSDRRA